LAAHLGCRKTAKILNLNLLKHEDQKSGIVVEETVQDYTVFILRHDDNRQLRRGHGATDLHDRQGTGSIAAAIAW
jgi:hypothetical protein